MFIQSLQFVRRNRFLFTTKLSMTKQVDGVEFDAAKKTIAGTKLNEKDMVLCVQPISECTDAHVVFQTHQGIFLRFALEEIPEKKKGAVGVRGMKLVGNDFIENVYLLTESSENTAVYGEKEVYLNKLRIGRRDTKGTKTRV